jgi:branched-chain amino acid transport system substrate-binding protein
MNMRYFFKFLIFLTMLSTAGCASVSDNRIVRIGHAGPLSGGMARYGIDTENGTRMAIEELNAKGIVVGGKAIELVLVSEDDAANPTQGVSAAKKLVDTKVAGIVGHLNSGTSIAASSVYFKAGIPQITPSASNPRYTRQGFNTAFRLIADDVQLGTALGQYAIRELKGKSIAVIDDRTVYGQGIAETFEAAVRKEGATIVTRHYTHQNATDFTEILTSIKELNADLIFLGGMDDTAGPLIHQMNNIGMHAKLIGGDGICTDSLPAKTDYSIKDGQVLCAEPGNFFTDEKAKTEFNARYKARFNRDAGIYAVHAYDAANLIVAAMVKADSTIPAQYLPALKKTNGYVGISDGITFDDQGDLVGGAITLFTFTDGKRVKTFLTRSMSAQIKQRIMYNEEIAKLEREIAARINEFENRPKKIFISPDTREAKLERETAELIKELKNQPKKTFISPSTRDTNHAMYYASMREKIEKLGTFDFPKVDGKSLYGDVIISIPIFHDGTIYEKDGGPIVEKSSGIEKLDNAALRIVRRASPFGAFPKNMRTPDKDDVWIITTRFKFTNTDPVETSLPTPKNQD